MYFVQCTNATKKKGVQIGFLFFLLSPVLKSPV